MSKNVTISPMTRVNGFWKVQVKIDKGQVVDAWSSGTAFRGFENILLGRDPRDAPYLTERICGICSTAHAEASCLALENALKIEIPDNAVLVRNLSFGADLLQNHLRHLYLLAFVDYFHGPSRPPFEPRFEWSSRFSNAETENLTNHYFEAITESHRAHEMVIVLGGKIPHQHGIIPGGVSVFPDASKIQQYLSLLADVEKFINEKLAKDIEMLARKYPEYEELGRGYGNVLFVGNFVKIEDRRHRELPGGVIIDGNKELFDPEKIVEHVKHSWFENKDGPLNPTKGKTGANLDKEGGYSFVKAPRYMGNPMEVGPLAYALVNGKLDKVSVMDRLRARVIELQEVMGLMKKWINKLDPTKPIFSTYEIPKGHYKGIGLTGAMRGALAHYVEIDDKKIRRYQVVTPSAWNCSPRDDNDKRGPIEEALIGTPIEDEDNPVEVGRVVRSFDPCLACATHIIKADGSVKKFAMD